MPTSQSDRPARAAKPFRCDQRGPAHDASPAGRRTHCGGDRAAFGSLGAYRDGCGRDRELVAIRGASGSKLVIDRDATTLSDRRLVAHLGRDEPADNAALVCQHYVADPAGRWCRPLRMEDLLTTSPGEGLSGTSAPEAATGLDDDARHRCAVDVSAGVGATADEVVEADGVRYCLLAVRGERGSHQLRWCRQRSAAVIDAGEWEQMSLREVIGELECYEPMRTITACALARDREGERLQLRRLRSEYERICSSPIVLNRALREAVLRAIERDGQSLSELALRCGVVKRDCRGRVSGETSWLARRVGLMAEGGRRSPTPWIHSDVLALIARRALRLSPREVEVP